MRYTLARDDIQSLARLIQKRQNGNPFCLFGAGNQNRTDDLVITNDVLYRLSHTSEIALFLGDLYIIANKILFVKPFLQFFATFWQRFSSHKKQHKAEQKQGAEA